MKIINKYNSKKIESTNLNSYLFYPSNTKEIEFGDLISYQFSKDFREQYFVLNIQNYENLVIYTYNDNKDINI